MKNIPKNWITYGFEIKAENFKPAHNDREWMGMNKPGGGLWACPVGSEYDFKDWCLNEGWCGGRTFDRATEFTIKDDVRALVIDSWEDFMIALEEYGTWMPYEERVLDWDRLREDFDLVYLTDKGNKECHYGRGESSLNTWDVESAVFLNIEKIGNFIYKEGLE
jgi:hypothetical protein